MASILNLKAKQKIEAGTVSWLDDCIARSNSGVVSEIITVTPGLAGELLRRNDGNRNIRDMKAAQYASDMAAGRWAMNGEPIIISASGELNDGQHRMQAVVDANISLPMLFVFGVSRESRKTVDQGAARSANDYLAMDGVKNSTVCAGLTRIVLSYESGNGRDMPRVGSFTNAEICARVLRDNDVAPAAEYAQSVANYTKGIIAPSVVGFCFYLLADICEGDARDYLDQVCVGENIKRGDPAFAVRNALSGSERRLSRLESSELIMRGWNAYRLGRRLTIAKRLGSLPALV